MNDEIKKLLDQEEELQFLSFSNEDALTLGLIIIDIAKSQYQKGVAINIERNHQVLFTHFMEGSTNDNLSWINRKKRVVERYDHSSKYTGDRFKAMGTTANEFASLPEGDYRAVGGSFPIIIKNTGAIGNVTVSGLTPEEDHDLCVMALKRLKAEKNDNCGKL